MSTTPDPPPYPSGDPRTPSSDPWALPGQHLPPTRPTPSGFGSPPPDAVVPGPVILQIGEIGLTSSVIRTPTGDIPLAGSSWHVTDQWHHEQRTPRWAIVCAVVLFCLVTFPSLLFLLAKETVRRGTVQVTVTNGTRQYVARLPVTDESQVVYVHQQVNYARSLAAL